MGGAEIRPDDGFRAWLAVLEAHARVAPAIERALQAGCGISLAWFEVLVRLLAAPEARLRQQELADALLVTKSGVTKLVDRIEAAGLVARVPDPIDRRSTHVVLTEAGRAMAEAAVPVHLAAVAEHFSRRLGPGDAATLLGVLGRVNCPGREPGGVPTTGD